MTVRPGQRRCPPRFWRSACAAVLLIFILPGAVFSQATEAPAPALAIDPVLPSVLPQPKPQDAGLQAAFEAQRRARRELGPLLFLGFQGDSRSSEGFAGLLRQVALEHVGGVLFLGQNIPRDRDELLAMTAALRAAAPGPLLIGVDQEGGLVERLKPWHGVPALPNARQLGQQPAAEVDRSYQTMACAVAELGFNVNFGPVLDVDLNPDNPIIGALGRSYSADAGQVAEVAGRFLAAHQRCGLGTVAKHFPGHGSATVDSHEGLPDVTRRWRPSEMQPYRQLIAAQRLPAVMTGHLFHNLVDAAAPASLSAAWIEDYLRGRLGFTGLVMTDDLDMAAISARYSPEAAVIAALAAGNDMALLGGGRAPYPDLARQILDALIDDLASAQPRLDAEKLAAARKRVSLYATGIR